MTLFIENFQSPNVEARKNGKIPRFLILHCTERDAGWTHDRFMNGDEAQENGRVSAHYLVLENGHVHQYVHENMRAWHAGVSYWGGETDLNSSSIGIELVNPGVAGGYPPYTPAQITATIALCRDILHRHPLIVPLNVLGHSDIAPGRKSDPGPAFPWAQLAQHGIGVMPDDGTDYLMENDVGRTLSAIGYNPDVPVDVAMQAFCEHYAPEGLGDAGFAAAHFKLWQMAAIKKRSTIS